MIGTIRAATEVHVYSFYHREPRRAVVVTPHAPGQGLDLLVEGLPGSYAAGLWVPFFGVLHRDRPERPQLAPYWLPIEDSDPCPDSTC
jgi:hypothetical protein